MPFSLAAVARQCLGQLCVPIRPFPSCRVSWIVISASMPFRALCSSAGCVCIGSASFFLIWLCSRSLGGRAGALSQRSPMCHPSRSAFCVGPVRCLLQCAHLCRLRQAPLSWVAPIASAFYPGAPAPPEAGLPPLCSCHERLLEFTVSFDWRQRSLSSSAPACRVRVTPLSRLPRRGSPPVARPLWLLAPTRQ